MLRQRVVLVYGLFVSILQAPLICVFALFRPRAQFQEPFLVRGPGARGPGPSYRCPSRGSQTWVLCPGPGSCARVQGVLVQGPPSLVLGSMPWFAGLGSGARRWGLRHGRQKCDILKLQKIYHFLKNYDLLIMFDVPVYCYRLLTFSRILFFSKKCVFLM